MATLDALKFANFAGKIESPAPKKAVTLNDSGPSRPPTPAKTPANKTKLSKQAVEYANTNLISKIQGNYKDPKQEAEQRSKDLNMVILYYEKFPEVRRFGQKEFEKFCATASPLDVKLELVRVKREKAIPGAEKVCRFTYLRVVDFVETFVSDYLPSIAPGSVLDGWNIKGTAAYLDAEEGLIDDEIKEISILLSEWLTQGPYLRLMIKTMQVAYMMHSSTEVDMKGKGKEYASSL